MKRFQVVSRITPRQEGVYQIYLREVQQTKPLTAQEEAELAIKIQQGDRQALEKLVYSNLRFVISVAKSYTSDPEILQDLISVGNIGLYECAPNFDPTLGFKFYSYAVWHIRKEMLKYLHTQARTIKVPGTNLMLLAKIKKFISQKEAENGGYYALDQEEILTYVRTLSKETANLTAEKLREILSFLPDVVSYDQPISPDAEITWLDLNSAPEPGQDKVVVQMETKELIQQALSQLPPVQAHIISSYHGMNKFETPKFYDDLSHELKRTPEWVRTQYAKGIRKMKHLMLKAEISTEDMTF